MATLLMCGVDPHASGLTYPQYLHKLIDPIAPPKRPHRAKSFSPAQQADADRWPDALVLALAASGVLVSRGAELGARAASAQTSHIQSKAEA